MLIWSYLPRVNVALAFEAIDMTFPKTDAFPVNQNNSSKESSSCVPSLTGHKIREWPGTCRIQGR